MRFFLKDYETFEWESLRVKEDAVKSALETAVLIKVGRTVNGNMRFGILVNPLVCLDKRYSFNNMQDIRNAINYYVWTHIIPCVCKEIESIKHRELTSKPGKEMGWYTRSHSIALSSSEKNSIELSAAYLLNIANNMQASSAIKQNYTPHVDIQNFDEDTKEFVPKAKREINKERREKLENNKIDSCLMQKK